MSNTLNPSNITPSVASRIKFCIQEINTILIKEREHHVHLDPRGAYTVVIGGKETPIATQSIEEILGFLEGVRYAYGRLSLDYLEGEGKMIDDIDRLERAAYYLGEKG